MQVLRVLRILVQESCLLASDIRLLEEVDRFRTGTLWRMNHDILVRCYPKERIWIEEGRVLLPDVRPLLQGSWLYVVLFCLALLVAPADSPCVCRTAISPSTSKPQDSTAVARSDTLAFQPLKLVQQWAPITRDEGTSSRLIETSQLFPSWRSIVIKHKVDLSRLPCSRHSAQYAP